VEVERTKSPMLTGPTSVSRERPTLLSIFASATRRGQCLEASLQSQHAQPSPSRRFSQVVWLRTVNQAVPSHVRLGLCPSSSCRPSAKIKWESALESLQSDENISWNTQFCPSALL
jgi:hypothetical protein